jgi:hypothetical protein
MSRASVPVSLFAVLLLVASGCGGGGGSSATPPAPSPTFSVQVSPGSLQVPAGGGGYVTVSVARLNGFTGAITLTGLGFPVGSSASGLVPDGAATLARPIVVSGTLAPATFANLQIEGRSGSLVQTAPFSLTVGPPLSPPQLSEDVIQAPGGRQGAGSIVNFAVVQEPLRAISATSPSGSVKVRHGYLPSGTPAQL